MRIAIDIDKTIFNCDSFLYKIINKYLVNQNIKKELKYRTIDLTKADYYICPFIKKVSKMHNPNFYTIEENASSVINNWVEQGDEIILLSSRPGNRSLVGALLICLNKYKVNFTKIVVACNNKALYCKKDNIDLLIDDSYQICNNAQKVGINTILYTAKYNACFKDGQLDNLEKANSWEEVKDIVNSKFKNKTNKFR